MWETLPTGELVWVEEPSDFDINEFLNEATQDEVNNYYNNGELPKNAPPWWKDILDELFKKAVPLIVLYIIFETKPWK